MPAPKSFGRDPGLQARMLATIFLLGLVYVVLIAVLIAAGVGAVTVAVIAGALFLVQYFSSDKLALYSMGAHEVSAEQAPELHATIERLCIQANLPMPRVRRRGRGTVTRGSLQTRPVEAQQRLIGDRQANDPGWQSSTKHGRPDETTR